MRVQEAQRVGEEMPCSDHVIRVPPNVCLMKSTLHTYLSQLRLLQQNIIAGAGGGVKQQTLISHSSGDWKCKI